MTHTIELSPTAERRIADKARRRGVPIEKYLSEVVEEKARELEPIEAQAQSLSEEDKRDVAARLAALNRIGKYDARGALGPSPADDVADLYREREDAQL